VSGASESGRIISTYYAIAGLFTLSAALIWGVNTLFLLDAGLDIFEVFLANAAFTAGMFVFEIPTGVLADTAGRRLSFLTSVALLSLTTVAYVFVARADGGLPAFCAVSVVMGLGFTFYSGAVEAWLVDALRSTGFDRSLDHVFARGSMVTGAAMLTGTVAGGVLGEVDLSLPYLVRAAIGVGLTGSFWLALALFVLLAVGVGMTGPVKQAYLHASIPSTERASVVSFDSMFGSGGGVVGQTGLGYLARVQSIEHGYVAGGLAALLALPLIARLRGLRHPADGFAGERAGAEGPCAAQGIPDIALVDARRRGVAAEVT